MIDQFLHTPSILSGLILILLFLLTTTLSLHLVRLYSFIAQKGKDSRAVLSKPLPEQSWLINLLAILLGISLALPLWWRSNFKVTLLLVILALPLFLLLRLADQIQQKWQITNKKAAYLLITIELSFLGALFALMIN